MKTLKRTLSFSLIAFLAIFTTINATAQQDKSKRPSPPAQAVQTIGDLTITIDYSQPSVKGRKIWEGLVPYGKVWRTGANEATWIEVSRDVTIAGKTLPKGKYGLFSIPGSDEWTIIFNKTWDQWGAYNYEADKDVLRVSAKAEKTSANTENFTIKVDEKGVVTILWEKVKVSFDID